jgi:hypothetical protein
VTKIDDLHRRWRKDPDYKGAYEVMGEEFDCARSLIDANTMVRLSPSQHAKKLKTPGRGSGAPTRKRASID